MSLRQYLEVLETKPHLPLKYYEEHLKAILHVSETLDKLAKANLFQTTKSNSFYKVVNDFSGSHVRNNIDDVLYALHDIHRNLIYSYSTSYDSDYRIANHLKYAIGEKDVERMIKHLGQSVDEYLLENLSKFKGSEFLQILEDAKQDVEEQKEYWDAEEHGPLQQFESQINELVTAIKMIEQMKEWYPKFVTKVKAHVDLFTRQAQAFYGGGGSPSKPKHEEVETLYHATTAMNAILRNGFKTREELGKGALGGGPSNLISFTSDYQIAEAIVWAIRRAIEIAQNKLNIKQLAILSKSLGSEFQKAVKHVISSEGGTYKTKSAYDNDSFFPKRRERNPDEQRQWLFQAFRYALASQSKVYDPLFFGVTIKDFEELDVNDIGILAAEVDMNQVKDYLPSMEEYRVPVNAIKKVWRVPYRGIFNPIVRYK